MHASSAYGPVAHGSFVHASSHEPGQQRNLTHHVAIETTPFQTYISALIFSSTRSLTRQLGGRTAMDYSQTDRRGRVGRLYGDFRRTYRFGTVGRLLPRRPAARDGVGRQYRQSLGRRDGRLYNDNPRRQISLPHFLRRSTNFHSTEIGPINLSESSRLQARDLVMFKSYTQDCVDPEQRRMTMCASKCIEALIARYGSSSRVANSILVTSH